MKHYSKVTLGDFKMKTKVFPEAEGFLKCEGKITSSVYFGKSGVGKSTVAGLTATLPGLFETKSSIDSTTTLGSGLEEMHLTVIKRYIKIDVFSTLIRHVDFYPFNH